LLLSAGKLAWELVGLIGKPDELEEFVGPLPGLALESPRTARGASVRLRSTVMWGKRLNCWNTMPSCVRILRRCASRAGTSAPFFFSCQSGSPPI
jgi:hypothetical protein